MKKRKKIFSFILLIIGILFIIGGNLLSNFSNKETIDNIDNNENIEIKNPQIETLFSYVIPPANPKSICLGFFYQNPFKNHSLDDKISLLLNNYGINYKKDIDDSFLAKLLDEDEKNKIQNTSIHYIEVDTIKEAMKSVFNIDLDNYKFNEEEYYYNYKYVKDVDAFIDIPSEEIYEGQILQQIIEYKETKGEVNLTIVKAEIFNNDTTSDVYRYVNKKDTLVFKNVTDDDFKFTKENINLFPQIKYVFKKNKNGKYYVSDVINLNFEEDFENCN